MTEEELLTEVGERCTVRDIWWVHWDKPHHNKKRGDQVRGFPDLLMVGPGGDLMFRELKSAAGAWRGIRGRQTDWKYRLQVGGQDWGMWSPADLESGRIDEELDQLAGRVRRMD